MIRVQGVAGLLLVLFGTALGCSEEEVPDPVASAEKKQRVAALTRQEKNKLLESGRPPRLKEAPRLEQDGDVFESRAFGFSIAKPPEWVFLGETSLIEDPENRLESLVEFTRILYKPAITPLVAMSPEPDPGPKQPLVRVFAIPPRPGDASFGNPTLEMVVTGRARNRGKHPNFEFLSEARPVDLAGTAGAQISVRYGLEDDEGREQPVVERIVHFQRDRIFWWIYQQGPDPLPEETVQVFDRVLASLRLSP